MEPQTGFETDERDNQITPENIKSTKFSKDYKDIIKLLNRFSAAESTVKLLLTCCSKIISIIFKFSCL